MLIRTVAHISGLTLLILTVLSCGGPYVEHSTISPQVRRIEQWRIEWAGRTDSTRTPQEIMKAIGTRSKYSMDEYCVQYVQKVKVELRDKYGLSFSENFPDRGGIVLELHGPTLSRFNPPDTAAERFSRGDPARPGYPEGKVSTGAVLGVTELLFTDRDRIDSVVVTIYDPAGDLAGKAMINADEVKPGHVAEVVEALITEGRYEEAPIKLKLD